MAATIVTVVSHVIFVNKNSSAAFTPRLDFGAYFLDIIYAPTDKLILIPTGHPQGRAMLLHPHHHHDQHRRQQGGRARLKLAQQARASANQRLAALSVAGAVAYALFALLASAA